MPLGMSCILDPGTLYFASEAAVRRWRKANPDINNQSTWAMHEISLKCLKALLVQSKRKIKPKCQECGK